MSRRIKKLEKRKRKQKQEKQRRQRVDARLERSWRIAEICDEADELIKDGEWDAARRMLEECLDRHLSEEEPFELLLKIYQKQLNYSAACRLCERRLKRYPDDLHVHLLLAHTYALATRPASALHAFHRFAERWPDDPLAEGVREMVSLLEAELPKMMSEGGFPPDATPELALRHEEIASALACGDFAETIKLAKAFLARWGGFTAALNNLAEAYFHLDRVDEALATSQQVLEREPGNAYALACQARYLLLSGRRDEAESIAQRLNTAQTTKEFELYRIAETFSYLGNDQAVLDIFEQARRAGATDRESREAAMLYHLAAVAHSRLGNQRRAERFWRTALDMWPSLDVAEANLEDAHNPPTERHGAWPFTLQEWLPATRRDKLVNMVADVAEYDEKSARAVAERFGGQHPEVRHLVPLLLERGDPIGRAFACDLAASLKTPELLDALRDFCLSPHGPDQLRLKMANELCYSNVVPPGRYRMWLKGQWEEVEMVGYLISHEPTGEVYDGDVGDWHYESFQALRNGDGQTAERLLRQCLEAVGDKPDLLNNLAMALRLQKRIAESAELSREVHQRWPGYFFGRLSMANLAIDGGDLETAEAYLAPLRRKKEFHVSEFVSLCNTHVNLALKRGNVAAAQQWLSMFKGAEPDHPMLETVERSVRWHSKNNGLRSITEVLGSLIRRKG